MCSIFRCQFQGIFLKISPHLNIEKHSFVDWNHFPSGRNSKICKFRWCLNFWKFFSFENKFVRMQIELMIIEKSLIFFIKIEMLHKTSNWTNGRQFSAKKIYFDVISDWLPHAKRSKWISWKGETLHHIRNRTQRCVKSTIPSIKCWKSSKIPIYHKMIRTMNMIVWAAMKHLLAHINRPIWCQIKNH